MHNDRAEVYPRKLRSVIKYRRQDISSTYGISCWQRHVHIKWRLHELLWHTTFDGTIESNWIEKQTNKRAVFLIIDEVINYLLVQKSFYWKLYLWICSVVLSVKLLHRFSAEEQYRYVFVGFCLIIEPECTHQKYTAFRAVKMWANLFKICLKTKKTMNSALWK